MRLLRLLLLCGALFLVASFVGAQLADRNLTLSEHAALAGVLLLLAAAAWRRDARRRRREIEDTRDSALW